MQSRANESHAGVRAAARWSGAALIVLICLTAAHYLTQPSGEQPAIRRYDIKADQYGYDPARIVVRQGDEVRLRLVSTDAVHGFFLEGHDLDAFIYPGRLLFNVRRSSSNGTYVPMEEVAFRADRVGKYRYRCSVTCGTLHPFMQGELVVEPNRPFALGMGASAGIWLAGLFLIATGDGSVPRRRRLDLLRALPRLGWVLRRPWFQLAFVVPALGLFLLFLIAGFWGSPVGNRNIIITFVWMLWWFLLIALFLPLGSRIWCMACPFPFFGDWLQRKRLLTVRPDVRAMWKGFKRWPRRLSNIWAQNLLFLALCTFSALLVTRPVVTAGVLTALVIGATLLAVVYRHRAFCSYLCPVSGFLSVYSMAAMVEVRPRDSDVCRTCRSKACVTGSERGWGCPWGQNPSRLERNNYCGMCMECIKTCPNGNMTLNARPPFADLHIDRADEAWKAFVMVSLALVYSVTLLGPWGTVKAWANISEVGDWRGFLLYALIVWAASLAILPGLWALACAVGRGLAGSPEVSLRTLFLRYAYLLVPVGLMAWVAFSVPLVMVNGTYILATASDPLGWGWNLFGTADVAWRPLFPESVVWIQLPLLLLGLVFSLQRGGEIAFGLYKNRKQAALSLLPPATVCTAIVMGFATLFTG